MSRLLARPPQLRSDPWSAWQVPERREPTLSGLSGDAERIDGLPREWPAAAQVVLVVPACRLSWQQASLPRLPAHRLRAALVGLLEERLLGDPAGLHLALAPQWRSGVPAAVAVCDKAWLQQQVSELSSAGHQVLRVVPEFEPGPPALFLLGQPDRAELIEVGPEGVQALAWSTREIWPPKAQQAVQAGAELWAEPALVAWAEQHLQIKPQLISPAQILLRAEQSAWDLAPMELGLGRPRRGGLIQLWREIGQGTAWRPLRWALWAGALLQLAGLQAWAWHESAQQRSLSQQRETLLRSTFPQTQVVIDPLLQMQREVAQLARSTGAHSADDLGAMLTALAQAGAPPAAQLEYSAGQLKLEAWSLGSEQVQPLRTALASRGYTLEGAGTQWQIRSRSP